VESVLLAGQFTWTRSRLLIEVTCSRPLQGCSGLHANSCPALMWRAGQQVTAPSVASGGCSQAAGESGAGMSEAQVQSLESVRIPLSVSGREAAVQRFDWLRNRATLKTACDAASLRTPRIHWTILKFHGVGEGVSCQAPVGRQKSRPPSSFPSGLASLLQLRGPIVHQSQVGHRPATDRHRQKHAFAIAGDVDRGIDACPLAR